MRTKSNSMSIIGWVIASAIVLGLFGALAGVLAVGRLEALPVNDNESMTVQINHMVKQAVGLLTGGLVGCLLGVVLPLLVAWSKRRG